jgi:cytidylate kinase
MGKDYIVTIDGPVGTGKSTISRLLARKKRLTYLDTGAMYRVVALEAQKKGVDSGDEKLLQELCSHVEIFFKQEGDGQRVFSYGRDVTDEIRTPEISMLASRVSAVKTVREALVKLQREIGKKGGIVVEGRDAGTVIFPNARFKFYLELVEKNIKVDYIDILQDIEKRDSDDSSRDISPLKPAAAAAVIDTTEMTIEDVLSRVSEEIELRSSSLP